MDSNAAPARDLTFAASMMLRCPGRTARILATIPEPRRASLHRALLALDGMDDAGLKTKLAEVFRCENALLQEMVAVRLGPAAWRTPRALRRFMVSGT